MTFSSGPLSVRRFSGVAGGDAAETTAFLARTSGLDVTHTNAYKALINGLVSDGVFSKFDALYTFATQDRTTAGLSLVSSTYNVTEHNTAGFLPDWTADRGYHTHSGGGNVDTNFNPTTAPSPKFVQNSAHMSLWTNENAQDVRQAMGSDVFGDTCVMFVRYTDDNFYGRVNGTDPTGFPSANSIGHSIINRSGASAVQAYRNGASLGSSSAASSAPFNGNIFCVAIDTWFPDSHTQAAASIGSSLSSTDAANFYTRLQAYMTAIGN